MHKHISISADGGSEVGVQREIQTVVAVVLRVLVFDADVFRLGQARDELAVYQSHLVLRVLLRFQLSDRFAQGFRVGQVDLLKADFLEEVGQLIFLILDDIGVGPEQSAVLAQVE